MFLKNNIMEDFRPSLRQITDLAIKYLIIP